MPKVLTSHGHTSLRRRSIVRRRGRSVAFRGYGSLASMYEAPESPGFAFQIYPFMDKLTGIFLQTMLSESSVITNMGEQFFLRAEVRFSSD
jgi:hypothetical protein